MDTKHKNLNSHFLETIKVLERNYFNNEVDQEAVFNTILILNKKYEAEEFSFASESDVKNLISILLILDRLKNNLMFESAVANVAEEQFDLLYANLDKIMAANMNDHEKGFDQTEDTNNDDFLLDTTLDIKDDSFSPSKQKNKRSNYPKKISRILKNWLKENMNNPYPSESEKAGLMKLTGLDATQINNWFINARRRILPFMKSKYIKYE